VTLFDLLFIAVFLSTILTLLAAISSAARGRRKQALHILKTLCIGLALYMGAVVLTSIVLPRRVLNVGDPVCYDDWCISVEDVSKQPARESSYAITLRLSSRARRRSQREIGIVVYLTNDRGQRFDPISENAVIPFNVMLQPQESVTTTRVFEVPADAHIAGLVITHEGSAVPISWFIIGYPAWFRKPAMVRLPS
jgi:hypothetical protein